MPKVSELPSTSPATVRALRDVVIGAETITTGASPVAADPDAGITYIITGGTDNTESITLATPTNPETKLGTRKKFVVRTVTHENDYPVIDNTNLVNAAASQLSESQTNEINLAFGGNWAEFELVYSASLSAYAWQIIATLKQGVRRLYTNAINGVGGSRIAVDPQDGGSATVQAANSTLADGGAVNVGAGDSDVSSGGTVYQTPGTGATDGGDYVVELPAAGSGRQGQFCIGNLPTTDPGIETPALVGKAVWLNAGVLTISAGE